MDALAAPVVGLKRALHSTILQTQKSPFLSGSTVVYGSMAAPVKGGGVAVAGGANPSYVVHTCGERCGEHTLSNWRKRSPHLARALVTRHDKGCEEVGKTLLKRVLSAVFGLWISAKKSPPKAQEAGVAGPIREAHLYRTRWVGEPSYDRLCRR